MSADSIDTERQRRCRARLAAAREVEQQRTLTSPTAKLIKIGAKVVTHGGYSGEADFWATALGAR
jgi:hypothetical protein